MHTPCMGHAHTLHGAYGVTMTASRRTLPACTSMHGPCTHPAWAMHTPCMGYAHAVHVPCVWRYDDGEHTASCEGPRPEAPGTGRGAWGTGHGSSRRLKANPSPDITYRRRVTPRSVTLTTRTRTSLRVGLRAGPRRRPWRRTPTRTSIKIVISIGIWAPGGRRHIQGAGWTVWQI